MGMDIVEFILEVEDAFDISIPDVELGHLETVGHFHAYLLWRHRKSERTLCYTSRVFYLLRHRLTEATICRRSDVRPSARLNALLPRANRRDGWKQIERSIGLDLPPLWFSPRFVFAVTVLVVLAGWFAGLLGTAAGGRLNFRLAGLVALCGLLCVPLLLKSLGPDWRNGPPLGIETVRELCRAIVAKNILTLAAEPIAVEDSPVWDRLRSIIVRQFNIRPEQVVSDARWRDLMG